MRWIIQTVAVSVVVLGLAGAEASAQSCTGGSYGYGGYMGQGYYLPQPAPSYYAPPAYSPFYLPGPAGYGDCYGGYSLPPAALQSYSPYGRVGVREWRGYGEPRGYDPRFRGIIVGGFRSR